MNLHISEKLRGKSNLKLSNGSLGEIIGAIKALTMFLCKFIANIAVITGKSTFYKNNLKVFLKFWPTKHEYKSVGSTNIPTAMSLLRSEISYCLPLRGFCKGKWNVWRRDLQGTFFCPWIMIRVPPLSRLHTLFFLILGEWFKWSNSFRNDQIKITKEVRRDQSWFNLLINSFNLGNS